MRLSANEREKAVLISQTLLKSCTFAPRKGVAELKQWVIDQINGEPILKVEYFDIVDGLTMQSINKWDDTDYPVGCITVYCGEEVRLIDNIKYKK